MKSKIIARNIAHTINARKIRPGFQQITLPVTYTHEHKIAAGCTIFIIEPNGDYDVKNFDVRYADIDPKIQQIYHAAYFEADEDLDARDDLIKNVAAAITK